MALLAVKYWRRGPEFEPVNKGFADLLALANKYRAINNVLLRGWRKRQFLGSSFSVWHDWRSPKLPRSESTSSTVYELHSLANA